MSPLEFTEDPRPGGTPAVEAAAAAVLDRAGDATDARRTPGRPRGAKDKRKRRPRTPARGRTEAPEGSDTTPAPPADPPSDAELALVGRMCGVAWRVLGGRFRRRPLERDEERQLAEVVVPVLTKYGLTDNRWAEEISLGMVLAGLWIATEVPAEPEPESPPAEPSGAEVVE